MKFDQVYRAACAMQVTALELIYITQATRKILDVATFKHLTALDIRLSGDGFIDDSTFALVGQLTLLEELSLHWLSRVSEEGLIEGLSSLARLTSLKLIDVTKVMLALLSFPVFGSLLNARALFLRAGASFRYVMQKFGCAGDRQSSTELAEGLAESGEPEPFKLLLADRYIPGCL